MTELIYFETQAANLCGQHCLNNLLQGHYFSADILAGIAAELDAAEAELSTATTSSSQNVDESGNFSISVLSNAIARGFGLELSQARVQDTIQAASAETLDPVDGRHPAAFLLHSNAHWFSVRKLHGVWWDLNSLLDAPMPITTFHLAAVLATLKAEGWSVFAVRGELPAPMLPSGGQSPARERTWYSVSELQASASTRQRAAADVRASARQAAADAASTDPEMAAALAASLQHQSGAGEHGEAGTMTEQEQMELAMALSQAQQGSSGALVDVVEDSSPEVDDPELAAAIAASLADAGSAGAQAPAPSPAPSPAPAPAPQPETLAAAKSRIEQVLAAHEGDAMVTFRVALRSVVAGRGDVRTITCRVPTGAPIEAAFLAVDAQVVEACRAAGESAHIPEAAWNSDAQFAPTQALLPSAGAASGPTLHRSDAVGTVDVLNRCSVRAVVP